MNLRKFHPTRRRLIQALLLAGGATPAMLAMVRLAGANSDVPVIPGVQEFKGIFKINGRIPRIHQVVKPGDVVSTGRNGSGIIIIGQHAYMIRENAELEFYAEDFEITEEGQVSGLIRVASGAVLSVFGKTSTRIETPFATIGIRGTACYVDVTPTRTYACVCYGKADLVGAGDNKLLETVKTTHHDSPRYIYKRGARKRIETAPVIDHTDIELRLLEKLVNRRPLFDKRSKREKSDSNDSY